MSNPKKRRDVSEEKESPSIDTQYTTFIICPHCGFAHEDVCEFDDAGKTECGKCEKEFEYVKDVSVSWSTYKVDYNDE